MAIYEDGDALDLKSSMTNDMRPQVRDLFGEVPVYWSDVAAWLTVVARIDPASPRAPAYARAWNVPAKIRAAKLRGDFERLTGTVDHGSMNWQARFTWALP